MISEKYLILKRYKRNIIVVIKSSMSNQNNGHIIFYRMNHWEKYDCSLTSEPPNYEAKGQMCEFKSHSHVNTDAFS